MGQAWLEPVRDEDSICTCTCVVPCVWCSDWLLRWYKCVCVLCSIILWYTISIHILPP